MEKLMVPYDFPVLIDQIREYMSDDCVVSIDIDDLFSFLEAGQDHRQSCIMHYSYKGSIEEICAEIQKLPSDFSTVLYTLSGDISLHEANEISMALLNQSSERTFIKFGARYDADRKDLSVDVYLFYRS